MRSNTRGNVKTRASRSAQSATSRKRFVTCETTARVSTCTSPKNYSASFNDCTPKKIFLEQELAWRLCDVSFIATADELGLKERLGKAQHFIFHSRTIDRAKVMN